MAVLTVLFIGNVGMVKLCIFNVSVPTAHIVIRNYLLKHKHVHIYLWQPLDSIAHVLKADSALYTLTAEVIVRFFSVFKGVVKQITVRNIFAVRTRTHPSATRRFKYL